jgi:hypothetical protein
MREAAAVPPPLVPRDQGKDDWRCRWCRRWLGAVTGDVLIVKIGQ